MGFFKRNEVKLTDGLFYNAQEKGKEYLLALNPDRLLAPCYEAMGKKPKDARYGGWEARGIAGHSLGHWLSACSMMYSATGDGVLAQRAKYAVDELCAIQDATGYVSGVSHSVYDTVFSGDFAVDRFSLAGEWVPWYSIHKIYQGLIDVYRELEYKPALECVSALADWAKVGTDKLTDEQIEKMLICEHGGMNEVFAELYEITKNRQYLNLAYRFTDSAILEPLAQNCDTLEGMHANTQIPKIIGALQIGTTKYIRAAQFFYDTVLNNRSYVIGGNSNFEHFEKLNSEPLSTQTCETCNTNNMLKLTHMLYEHNQDKRYFDDYERSLYNHILASQDPDSGMKTYFMPMLPGHFKVYCTPEDSFWCCTGTGMENPARYGCDIYYQTKDALYVNLYISSEVTYNGMRLSQTTTFPVGKMTHITVEDGEGDMTLKVRVPSWNVGPLKAGLNQSLTATRTKDGVAQLRYVFEELFEDVEDGYLTIRRHFKKGDKISFGFNPDLTIYRAKDDPHKVSFMYGPLVLAGIIDDPIPQSDIQGVHTALDVSPRAIVSPIITNETDVHKMISLIDPDVPLFTLEVGDISVLLRPFHLVHHTRYTLYWNMYTPDEYEHLLAQRTNYEDELDALTVDRVRPNEQQSEIDHSMVGVDMESGYMIEAGSGYRSALGADGTFSYTLKAQGAKYLMVTYWGGDDQFTKDEKFYLRNFAVLVDGVEITRERLHAEKEGEFVYKYYELENNNKDEIVAVFSAINAQSAVGGVFGVRTMTGKINE